MSNENKNEVAAPAETADLGPADPLGSPAERFAALFAGLKRGFGTYTVDAGDVPPGTKRTGKAVTHKQVLTRQNYVDHLHKTNGIGLGVIPINEESTCVFGALDIDVYNSDFDALLAKIDKWHLPLVPCQSKSGGLHLYVFMTEAIPAALMRARLTELAAALGFTGCEMFPKQEQLSSDKDIGNWINLPYFGGLGDALLVERFAFNMDVPTRDKMSFAAFLDFAEERRITREQLEKIQLAPVSIGRSCDVAEPFADGPPCLSAYLVDRGAKFGGSGQRNDTLSHAVVYLKHKYGDDYRPHVLRLNQTLFSTPLGSTEVATIIKSNDRKEYGYRCDLMERYCNRAACEKRAFGVNVLALPPEPWGTPQEPYKLQMLPPPLPRGMLPKVIEDFAFGNPQFYPGALAACALAACATALTDAIKVEAIHGFTQSARLWYSPTGSPSSRKTPAQRAAYKPLYEIERQYFNEWKEEYKAWKADPNKDKGDQPVRKRLLTTDVTIEKVAELCARTPAGIGWCPEELSSAIYQIEGGRQQAANQRGDWLKTYDGGSHVVDRIARGEILVENFSLTLCAGNTLDKLERNYRELPADGLMARIGMILTPPPTPTASIQQFAPGIEAAYDRLIQQLASHRERDVPFRIPLSDAALRAFEQFKYQLEIDAVEFEDTLPRYAERRGKGLGEALRVACVFHLVECNGELDMDPRKGEVSGETMARACAWVNWQQANDRLLYEYLEGNEISLPVAVARLVADHLLAHQVPEFQLSAITSGVKAWRDLKPWDRYAAVDLLVQLGWIRTQGVYWRGGTFVHGKVFEVNPAAHELYRQRGERVRKQNAERRAQLEAAADERRRQICKPVRAPTG